MRIAKFSGCLATCLALAVGAASAFAGTAITIATDHAKILSVAGTPTSIIVGNPMFADVSLQGGKVVLLGRASGQTNIIMLDGDGNQLANFDVTVTRGTADDNLTMYMGGERMTLVCSPVGEPTLLSGDSPDYMKSVTDGIQSKIQQSQSAAGIGGNP